MQIKFLTVAEKAFVTANANPSLITVVSGNAGLTCPPAVNEEYQMRREVWKFMEQCVVQVPDDFGTDCIANGWAEAA